MTYHLSRIEIEALYLDRIKEDEDAGRDGDPDPDDEDEENPFSSSPSN